MAAGGGRDGSVLSAWLGLQATRLCPTGSREGPRRIGALEDGRGGEFTGGGAVERRAQGRAARGGRASA
jgi:hypothetical protein